MMTYEDFATGRREFIPRADYEYKWHQRFIPATYEDALTAAGNEWDRQVDNHLYAPLDVLNQDDTISMQDLEEPETPTDFQTAGFAEETAVNTFINMNGDTRYVHSI